MSFQDGKPVGSEFPPPPPAPSKDIKNINVGAEFIPEKDTTSPIHPPPAYPAGPSGNMTSFTQQTQQTPYSQPTSPTQQNAFQLTDRSLPPPPSQTGYAQPQQPQQPYQQPYQQTFQQPGMYVMQPQMQNQMNPQQVHVINMGAPMAGLQIMSHTPVRIVCPNCNNEVTTIVTETPGNTAYLWALVLFCICFPLMWLPCVLPGCLDKTHTCPACRYVLAYIKV